VSETMRIDEYLSHGGVLTSPDNVSPRYRGELMRIMASFVDSELAGAAGFADVINDAPGIRERIAAARIVADKLEHGGRVLGVMGTFGANIARYANFHPWAARIARDADIGAARAGSDMRLSVFHYPLEGWIDSVVMNVLMGKAVMVQVGELEKISYQPLAEVFRSVLPGEIRHAESGVTALRRILADPVDCPAVQSSIDYWKPRVAASFGGSESKRFDFLKRFGLRHRPNEALLSDWTKSVDELLVALKVDPASRRLS